MASCIARAQHYPLLIVQGADGLFVAKSPDIPQIVGAGRSAAEAADEAVNAIASALEVFEADGQALPAPMSSALGLKHGSSTPRSRGSASMPPRRCC